MIGYAIALQIALANGGQKYPTQWALEHGAQIMEIKFDDGEWEWLASCPSVKKCDAMADAVVHDRKVIGKHHSVCSRFWFKRGKSVAPAEIIAQARRG